MAKRRQETQIQQIQPLLLSIAEVAASLRLSRAKVYMLIDCEGLPVVRFGRAVRVSVISLEQWLARREKGA
jgi:excisionase family DNA binding protein